MVTTGFSLEHYLPTTTTPSITRKFREAGALILAKANACGFAVQCRAEREFHPRAGDQPYDLTRTPGGSEQRHHGARHGGHFAGFRGHRHRLTHQLHTVPVLGLRCVGIRPTIGLVSRDGISPYSLDQDTAGPITWNAVRVLDVIAGYDPADRKPRHGAGAPSYMDYLCPDGPWGKAHRRARGLQEWPEHEDVNAAMKRGLERHEGGAEGRA